ncbi:MAG: Na/Pi cotransporter family protein [Phascolarctobacterium sp.]|nr:Na/Pi cotransporter family protein [Phascolarctobacterium sp.]
MLLYFIGFLGGVALFMYGVQLMGDGLQKVAGARLQKVLEVMTGVLPLGILLGAVVTAVLQASGATTVMTVGIINAGLLTLKHGFGIIMGSNIGTTITAQLVAFKLSNYVPVIIFAGFLVQYLAKRRSGKFIGQVLFGFGLLMLGMDAMGKSVMPLREKEVFVDLIGMFSSNPLVGILAGLAMTAVVQSSSATIGILIAMTGQGLIPLEGAIPVLLGDNIGSCITAVLAAIGANVTAKRLALAHVMFNVIGSIICVAFMGFFLKMVMAISPAGDIARQIANAHSAFNIINTLLFMPFVNLFIKLIEKLVPEKQDAESAHPVYLDLNMLKTPSIAMSLALKEVVRMGHIARKNVGRAIESITDYNDEDIEKIFESEAVVDSLEKDITIYLTAMSEDRMDPELAAKHVWLLHACNDIERIGDHGESLAKNAVRIFEEEVKFSDEANEEMRHLKDLVMEASGKALDALETGDKALAAEAAEICREARRFQKEARKNHIMRLNENRCQPASGFVMLEMMINMKRVADHSRNICHLIMGTF